MQQQANVISVRIKNFLSVGEAEIRPGQVTQIVGANNQGKTTVLKALEFAFSGGTDPALVKNGEEAAEVVIELADETTIRRRLSSAGKQSVSVKRGDMSSDRPQAFLDGLVAESAFNPLSLLDPKLRNDAIMGAIDFRVTADQLIEETKVDPLMMPQIEQGRHGIAVIDEVHKYFYQRRAEANRDTKERENRYRTYKEDLGAPPEPPAVSLDQLVSDLEQVTADLNAIDTERGKAEAARTMVRQHEAQIANVDREIESLKQKHAEIMKQADVVKAQMDASWRLRGQLSNSKPDAPAEDAVLLEKRTELIQVGQKIKEQMNQWKHVETFRTREKQVDQLGDEMHAARKKAEDLDRVVTELSGPVKQRLMASVEMPIPGLTYADGKFLVDGVAVDNLSTSKAMRLALGIARKHAKKTRIICIDGAEALDEVTWAALREEMEGDGFTYFVTRVGRAFAGSRGDRVVEMKEGQVVQ